jgi:hypothetical protein
MTGRGRPAERFLNAAARSGLRESSLKSSPVDARVGLKPSGIEGRMKADCHLDRASPESRSPDPRRPQADAETFLQRNT